MKLNIFKFLDLNVSAKPTREIAIDLGTANTGGIKGEGILVDEPT